MENKKLSIRVPIHTWEAFYRVFPLAGERSAFLRTCVDKAIEMKDNEQETRFIDRLMEELRVDYGLEDEQ